MNIAMLVNRVSPSTVPATVEINGEATEVTVPQTEVELVDQTGQHGSLILRFRSKSDRDMAKEKFVQGETVEITV